jgi:hypothetical protein
VAISSQFLNTCPGEDPSYIEYNILPMVSLETRALAGEMYDLTLQKLENANWSATTEHFPEVVNPDNPQGCPSIVFYLGQFWKNGIPSAPEVGTGNVSLLNDSIEVNVEADVTLLVCTQNIEEIQVMVTFTYPDFLLDSKNPPVLDEDPGSRKIIDNPTFQLYRGIIAELNTPSNISANNSNLLGTFYNAVTSADEGIPVTELLGESNAGRLINGSSRLYARYIAQAMSLNIRSNITYSATVDNSKTNEIPVPTVLADLIQITQLRLIQNNVSKIVLQVLLGIILFCNVWAAWFGMDTRRILKGNPWSIARKAGLLVDRATMDIVGTAKLKDIRDVRFSLKWWDDTAGSGKGWFGIDISRNDCSETRNGRK